MAESESMSGVEPEQPKETEAQARERLGRLSLTPGEIEETIKTNKELNDLGTFEEVERQSFEAQATEQMNRELDKVGARIAKDNERRIDGTKMKVVAEILESLKIEPAALLESLPEILVNEIGERKANDVAGFMENFKDKDLLDLGGVETVGAFIEALRRKSEELLAEE